MLFSVDVKFIQIIKQFQVHIHIYFAQYEAKFVEKKQITFWKMSARNSFKFK